jgi:acetoacetate decarboxylase
MPDSTGFGDYTESGPVIRVRYRLEDIEVKEAWSAPAELFRHLIADVARLPVLEVISVSTADLTLGNGQVAFDY